MYKIGLALVVLYDFLVCVAIIDFIFFTIVIK